MKLKLIATVVVTWEVTKNIWVPCNFVYNQWTQTNDATSFCQQQVVTQHSQEFNDPDPLVAQALADNFIGSKPHGDPAFSISTPASFNLDPKIGLEGVAE